MFIKQTSVSIAKKADISKEIVAQIVAGGGTKHGTNRSTITVETRDGDFLSFTQNSSDFTVKFGHGVDANGHLIVDGARGEGEYWYDSSTVTYQLDTWRYDAANAQLFVMRLSSATAGQDPYYFIMGRYKHEFKSSTPVYPFIISGSYSRSYASSAMALPYNGRGNTYKGRCRLFLPANSIPNQGSGVFSSYDRNSSNDLLGPADTAFNYRAYDSAGGGLPLMPANFFAQTTNKEVYFVGSLPLFYATTGYPDGKVVKKAGRSFLVCRTGSTKKDNDDHLSVFLMEIPTGA
ncbi:TPA: hypothetical protein ACRZ4F_002331 [Vibrio harveyi]|uniref:Uncharacterized protein n=1 Tax=Vibrio harveyi TaxID=669 RepID=A0ABM5Y687_VIBHA|nr:hypothetical protein [Vibrio harveyi]AMG01358.1 hypothetical protein AL538_27300 [Vibrio harveyi]